jgi:hypothetical protein
MYKGLLFIGLVLLCSCTDTVGVEAHIEKIMHQQEEAWNEKNIEGFMEPYWHSEELRFMGKSGVTLGWQSTLDRYKKNYTPENMGRLRFDDLHFDVLSSEATWVDGRWMLFRDHDTLSGRFSLLWKRMDEKWQIVADHSS